MKLTRPRAITMWDFSWLERRWPGAGYEDIDEALDGLVERGYDAVRIDAYPHHIAADPTATFELIPCWGVNSWGATMRCRVSNIQAELHRFIEACAQRDIAVGLSSWFRRDTGESWRTLCTPKKLAEAWTTVLDGIRDAGLMDHILYLDLCNEWPLRIWAPFLYGQDVDAAAVTGQGQKRWSDDDSLHWIRSASANVRSAYPDLAITTSIHPWSGEPAMVADSCDFFEPHIWMAGGEFYHRLGWTFQRKWDDSEFELVAAHAEKLYRADTDYWNGILAERIHGAAADAAKTERPLITTECWGIVDYKDAPLLDWQWVKDACAFGTRTASATGAWAAIATSNFCGPQFVGMWRDIAWHRELTDTIKSAALPAWASRLTGVA